MAPLHEHTALEQTFMLEGSLEDAEGRCGAGDSVWRPGGNIHVAHAPDGATFLSIFNRPNRFFDGTKFFTSGEERRQQRELPLQNRSSYPAKAGIQYAAALRFYHCCLRDTGYPPFAGMMTLEHARRSYPDDYRFPGPRL